MSVLNVAWWNLENYFDVEDAPNRLDKLARTLRGELEGWNDAVLARKTGQLASIIAKMFGGEGPDILGVCEVENRSVLDRLNAEILSATGRSYNVIHADTGDERGIDVAFLYDPAKLQVEEGMVFSHFIVKRTATRDIVQVNFITKPVGNRLVVIGNHWPSRTGGSLESEAFRIIAGETLGYFDDRIQQVHGSNVPILVMGDFNDEPFNKSITDHALGTLHKKRVEGARGKPWLHNLMWELVSRGEGTFYFDTFNVLDQFMVSKGITGSSSKFGVKADSVRIETFPEMLTSKGGPRKFGRPSQNNKDENGYSDHFPISLTLVEN
jgi:predicted extracellular nuclease